MKTLGQLLGNLSFQIKSGSQVAGSSFDLPVLDLIYDSRKAKENTVFFAIVGETVNAHKFVNDVYEKGCRIFVVSEDVVLPEDTVIIKVENVRVALSSMSNLFFGQPSKELVVIGITGTKGKTSVASYIRHVFESSGVKTGIIGTYGIVYGDCCQKTSNTTPESYILHKALRDMANEDVQLVVMEVSSGAMMMHRCDDVAFQLGIFTNLSPDHIGPTEHPNFEDYIECKCRLFKLCNLALIGQGTPYMDQVLHRIQTIFSEKGLPQTAIKTYGISDEGQYTYSCNKIATENDPIGISFNCVENGVSTTYFLPALGQFTALNGLAAIGACRGLGLLRSQIKDHLSNAKVPGRFEVMDVGLDGMVILDYAHNKASMDAILQSLKEVPHNRLICVFGSVGQRTQIRRKELGESVSTYCDIAIITSEDPGFENPMDIINEIHQAFLPDSNCQVIKEVDRALAIEKALALLEKGDILVIAGKSQDKYNLVNGVSIPYDEPAIVREKASKLLASKEK